MTITNVIQAALFALTIVTAVAAFAVALFGSAAALERWLDGPRPSANPTRPQLGTVARKALAPIFDPDAQTHAA
jgi:hypothetical protein